MALEAFAQATYDAQVWDVETFGGEPTPEPPMTSAQTRRRAKEDSRSQERRRRPDEIRS